MSSGGGTEYPTESPSKYNCSSRTTYPKGPCKQIVDTLAPKYPNRDYFKAKVYTIWAHGHLGLLSKVAESLRSSAHPAPHWTQLVSEARPAPAKGGFRV